MISDNSLYKNLPDQDKFEEIDVPIRHLSRWYRIKRWVRFWWQRRIRGWDDSQTWWLYYHIAKWTLPRLRRFRQLNDGYPQGFTATSWAEALDDMIYALEYCCSNEDLVDDWGRVERGLKNFGLYFRDLWW
jgi:hypothetical protein